MEQSYTATVKRINTATTARIVVASAMPGWPEGRAFIVKLDRIRDSHGHRQRVAEGDRLHVVIDSAHPERIARAERLNDVMSRGVRGGKRQAPHLEFATPLQTAEA